MKVEFLTVKVITSQRNVFIEIITGIMFKKYECQYAFACKPERMALGRSVEDKFKKKVLNV